MNRIDVALVVLLLLCGLRGSWRGVFREAFGFLAVIAGLWAALRWADTGAAWLGARLPWADLNEVALVGGAFVITYLAVSTLLNIAGLAFDQLLGRGPLELPSRVGGAVFALGKGAAVLAVVLLFLQLFPVVHGIDRQILDSRLGLPLMSTAEAALRAGWGGATDAGRHA
ncbi:MAG: CvpA family protein [Candidatus Binatia bacterium]